MSCIGAGDVRVAGDQMRCSFVDWEMMGWRPSYGLLFHVDMPQATICRKGIDVIRFNLPIENNRFVWARDGRSIEMNYQGKVQVSTSLGGYDDGFCVRR